MTVMLQVQNGLCCMFGNMYVNMFLELFKTYTVAGETKEKQNKSLKSQKIRCVSEEPSISPKVKITTKPRRVRSASEDMRTPSYNLRKRSNDSISSSVLSTTSSTDIVAKAHKRAASVDSPVTRTASKTEKKPKTRARSASCDTDTSGFLETKRMTRSQMKLLQTHMSDSIISENSKSISGSFPDLSTIKGKFTKFLFIVINLVTVTDELTIAKASSKKTLPIILEEKPTPNTRSKRNIKK